jgi:hypothetical protein
MKSIRRLLPILALVAAVLLSNPPDAAAQSSDFTADLSGGEVVSPQGQGNAGDPNGSGHVLLQVALDGLGHATICITPTTRAIQLPVTAFDLHFGDPGKNGQMLVSFTDNYCKTVDLSDPLDEILVFPDRFYFDVHDHAFPNGALRGQLDW